MHFYEKTWLESVRHATRGLLIIKGWLLLNNIILFLFGVLLAYNRFLKPRLHQICIFRFYLPDKRSKSQKDRQNYKNAGIRRAILPKCPSRRANPSLNGQLGNTAIHSFFAKGESSCRQTVVSTLQPEGKQYQDTGDSFINSTSLTWCPQVQSLWLSSSLLPSACEVISA